MSAETPRIHTFLVVKAPDDLDRVVVWDTEQISVGRATENDASFGAGTGSVLPHTHNRIDLDLD